MAETSSGPIGLGVKLPFATAAEFVARYRENVTRGGVYLRAKKVLPPGTLVNLDLKLTNGERLIQGSAVVHFVTGQNGTGTSGLGLKFLALDDASKKFIDEMLAGHPSAFSDTPPVPAGAGSVQYADKPQTDTAVTSVMSIPAQDLFGAQPIPMPAPAASPPPSVNPVTVPSVPPVGAASDALPLPAPGDSVAPSVAPATDPVAPVVPPVATAVEPLPNVPWTPPASESLPFATPAQATPPASDPFSYPTPAQGTPVALDPLPFATPAQGTPAALDPLPFATPAQATPPRGTPASGTPSVTPSSELPFATPEAPPRPVEVTSFPPQSASAHPSPPQIDPALLDRLEVDPSDPRAVLGLRPAALPDEAGSAAARMKTDLHLDEPGDPITTRLRRMLAHRLDAAVEALVRPAATDSPALAAARSLVDGDPQAAYAAGTESVDPQAKALAFAAACAMASQTRKAEWIDKASLLAKDAASATFLGSPWMLLAQAAHAAGDATELKKALEEVAKQDPASPFVGKGAASGKGGSPLLAIVLLVVGLAGGFAGGLFGGPMLGLGGKGKPVEVAKAEPAKTEPAKTEPAKTEPAKTEPAATASAEPAKTEPAKTEPAAEPAKTEPAKTEPATTVAAADPTKTEPAKTEPAKAEPAKAEPAKTEPAKIEPAKAEPAKTEPAKIEPAKTEPAKTEPAKTAKVEPAKTEPAKPKLSPAEEKAIVEKEAEFLKNVEEAMGRKEPCMPAMGDLGDIAATSPKPVHIGQAIILRARCFEASSKSIQARAEYKKYAKWFPKGPYIDEARGKSN